MKLSDILTTIEQGIVDPKHLSKNFHGNGVVVIGEGTGNRYHSVSKTLNCPLGKITGHVNVAYLPNVVDPTSEDVTVSIGFTAGGEDRIYGGFDFHRNWRKIRDEVASRVGVAPTTISKGFEEDGNGFQNIRFKLPKKDATAKKVLNSIIEWFNDFSAAN